MKAVTRLATIGACACALWVACTQSDIQLFVAGQYLPNLDCVTPGYAIDVVTSPQVDASCDAACIVPMFDSGVYVSGQCAPFPPGDLVNPDSGICVKALAAINRHDLCLDGGPSNPIDAAPPPTHAEASTEMADAAHDANDAHDAHDAGPG